MRKNSRHSPHTVVQPNLNQTHLIQQIIAFMQLDCGSNQTLSTSQKASLRAGCCHGFSLVFSYMEAIGKSAWWLECLEILSTWDGQAESLQQIKHLSQSRSPKGESVHSILTRLIHYVLFHQVTSSSIPTFSRLKQVELTNPESHSIHFESDECKIEARSVASGYFQEKQLEDLLQEEAFRTPSMMIATIQAKSKSTAHTISIHYSTVDKHWVLYDSNSLDGARIFSNKHALIQQLIHRYTPNIRLEYLSLNQSQTAKAAQSRFTSTYNNICYSSPLTLMQSYGYVIADQTEKIMSTVTSITEQLTSGCQDIAQQAVNKLIRRTPQGDTQLIQAMCVNSEFYDKMLSLSKTSSSARFAILSALFTVNHDRDSGYKQLCGRRSPRHAKTCLQTCLTHTTNLSDSQLIRLFEGIFHHENAAQWRDSSLLFNAPDLIVFLLRLSEHSDRINIAWIEFLSKKNIHGTSGLEKLLQIEPGYFNELIKTCHGKPSLSHTMSQVIRAATENYQKNQPHPFNQSHIDRIMPLLEKNSELEKAMKSYFLTIMDIQERPRVQSPAEDQTHLASDPITQSKNTPNLSASEKKQKVFQKKILQHCLRPLHEFVSSKASDNYLNRHLINSLLSNKIETTQSIAHLLSGTAQEKSYQRYLHAVDTFITACAQSSDTVISDLDQLEKIYRSLTSTYTGRFFSRRKTSLFSQQRASMMTLICDYHTQLTIDETLEQPSFVTTIINPLLRSCMVVAIHLEEWFSSLMISGVLL